MTMLAINGRFLTQQLTGVQRFAMEITRALLALPGGAAATRVLTPRAGPPASSPTTEPVGRFNGHAWEQFDLPRHAAGAILISLGNTAPLLHQRQIVVLHDAGVFATPEAYGWRFRAWYRVLHRALLWRGARIATVSQFARGELVRHLGADPSRIAVLGEGAEHILRTPAAPDIRAALGLERPYVLAVGSLAAHKNLGALGTTARALAERGFDLVLTGDLNARVFDAAALPEPARRVGRVDDSSLRALYEQASCFVFPSRYEGFGLPAVEAMACGCPVVAARAGALPEICAEAARYCDPASADDIAAAVLDVVGDKALAETLRQRGRQRAASFTWDRAARALLEFAMWDQRAMP